jgi:hypothetical protein
MIITAVLLGSLSAAIWLASCRLILKPDSPVLAIGLVGAALIYIGFAAWEQASPIWITVEAVGVCIYSGFASLSRRYSNWWLAVGWLLHPVWDLGLHWFGAGARFTPTWYVLACVGFDLLVASYVGSMQLQRFSVRIDESHQDSTP